MSCLSDAAPAPEIVKLEPKLAARGRKAAV
jgi:hypothetical protein